MQWCISVVFCIFWQTSAYDICLRMYFTGQPTQTYIIIKHFCVTFGLTCDQFWLHIAVLISPHCSVNWLLLYIRDPETKKYIDNSTIKSILVLVYYKIYTNNSQIWKVPPKQVYGKISLIIPEKKNQKIKETIVRYIYWYRK